MDKKIRFGTIAYWKDQGRRIKKHKSYIWFLLPAIILTTVFSYIPMVGTLISFKSDFNLYIYSPVEAFFNSAWTMENYVKIFQDAEFIAATKNTLMISGLKILFVFPLSIILAIMLSEIKKPMLSKFLLIVLCLPQFLSWAVVIGMWSGFLSDVDGAVNNILVSTHIIDSPFWFFGSNFIFKGLSVFLSAWKTTGWNSILFYAAIVSIDKTFFEAATIEGATKMQKIRHLTIPTIMPTIALLLVMNITYIMDAGFEQIYTMMNSETKYTQQILGTYLYDISIVNRSNIPFATALGVFNGFIALSFMLIGNKIVKKTLGKSLW